MLKANNNESISKMSAEQFCPGIRFKNGTARVWLWSPKSKKVEIILTDSGTRLNLERQDMGYWLLITDLISPGDRYFFILDGEQQRPDPASLSQPDGVHEASKAIDLSSFEWTDQNWKNPELGDYLLYELHTGTFSVEGTFDGISSKLDHLIELGVNAIEIMPIAQFPGTRNWGYDGVFPFAVQNSYGGAEGLTRLVNECHARGIAVVLDVVYNHMGPEGNYLGDFGPYFTDKYHTPWGNALNFDDAWCDGVRDYFVQNALMWFRDFHIDALRLDAVHAIKDFSALHILEEIRSKTDKLTQETGRTHYLIAELDLNDPKYIKERSEGGYGMHAQWTDEFHHALRVTAGGETTGYYSDFSGIEHLAKSYRDAYVYDGQWSEHRKKKFGKPAADRSGGQFVVFSQNHDQVGNRMLGERSTQLYSFGMQKLMAAAVICSPYLPMLFMGEEWAEMNPFQYFVSHTDPELAEAVRKGRKAEFAAFHDQGEAPDPMAEETFLNSKLQWDALDQPVHSLMLNYYKSLIALRKELSPLHKGSREDLTCEARLEKNTLLLHRWHENEQVCCLMNFSKALQEVQIPDKAEWRKRFDSAAPEWSGSYAAPEQVMPGGMVDLQPESIVIYYSSRSG